MDPNSNGEANLGCGGCGVPQAKLGSTESESCALSVERQIGLFSGTKVSNAQCQRVTTMALEKLALSAGSRLGGELVADTTEELMQPSTMGSPPIPEVEFSFPHSSLLNNSSVLGLSFGGEMVSFEGRLNEVCVEPLRILYPVVD